MSLNLIPRAVLFADPEKTLVKMSLDGKWLSFLAPHQGVLNLWVAPLAQPQAAKPLTQVKNSIKNYWWAANHTHLLFIHDESGDENWQLHGVQVETQQLSTYTAQGLQARMLHMSPLCPQQILITLNARDRKFHDVHQLDLLTGDLKLIYQNQRYWDFVSDDHLTLQIALQVQEGAGTFWDIAHGEPKPLMEVSQHDLMGLYFYPHLRLGLSSDRKNFYLLCSTQTDTSSLMAVNMDARHATTLANNAKADICDVLLDPSSKEPIAFAANYERKKWYTLNPVYEQDFQRLQNKDAGDLNILSQDAQNENWLVEFVHDNNAAHYYHYQRSSAQLHYLFASYSQLPTEILAKMTPTIIKTRDGLECVSYLSLPAQQDQGNGLPTAPLPLVLWVHGGPNFRDFWGLNAIHQWLANRGYAVLSVNYRGSTGFGKKFALAGNGEWGNKIQEDLLDAVEWACQQGIAQRERIAIMGRSFGGYAVLMGLTLTPEVFCCGVDIVGPANLNTLVKHFPPYWKVMQGALHNMLGCDPNTPAGEEFLAGRSPLFFAQQITKPLLIGHGANDVRVLQSESDQMVSALQANQIPVTYVVFPDEGHQFAHPGNRMAFYALAEAFLAKNLGGKCEPFDNQLDTSMQVKKDDFHLLVPHVSSLT